LIGGIQWQHLLGR